MKTLITILFLSLLSSPSWSETQDDLRERDGVYYKRFSDVPFSGKVTGLSKGSIKNGMREGAWITYHFDGQLHYKGNYKNGKREGAWISYWSNGQLRYKGNYENGEEEGMWVNYERVLRDGAWVRRVLIEGTGIFKNGVKISD